MDVRLAAAVAVGRGTARVSRLLGRGGGTALPGLVAERLDPRVTSKLAQSYRGGAVTITGTNGKTTASRMLASILEEAGAPFMHNREGSNLMRGIASTLLAAKRPRKADRAVLLLEVDEATLPAATAAVQPRIMVFTNLFRDQLDRYGEVDSVASLWREALAVNRGTPTLVLNADDPSVAELGLEWPGRVHWFGLDDEAFSTSAAGAFDARWCRQCGSTFAYSRRYFAHVGHWRCKGCGRERPVPGTEAQGLALSLEGGRFSVPGIGEVRMPLTGTYNVYNALAAIAAARELGAGAEDIVRGLARVEAAFGRQEVATIDGRKVVLLLTKNPAGANEVLRLLSAIAGDGAGVNVAALLNDRFADGQDVSWTWDVDYELLAGKVARCWAGGDRAADMALRLKYAGWPEPLSVAESPAELIDAVLSGTAPGERVFAIHTYTAMLEFREELERRGAVKPFWEL